MGKGGKRRGGRRGEEREGDPERQEENSGCVETLHSREKHMSGSLSNVAKRLRKRKTEQSLSDLAIWGGHWRQ